MLLEPKIKAIAHVINSRADVYGNRYFAASVTNTLTGATASGTISGDDSNISYALHKMYDDYESYRIFRSEMGYREFHRLTKHMEYMGCTPDDINPFIIRKWKEAKNE